MYGFPSETERETVDGLEFLRQLFEAGCLQSAYWHRFALTLHSPISRDPAAFGIEILPTPHATFARNELPFNDSVHCDHALLGEGLRKATYNFMHGVGLDFDVRSWFEKSVPRPSLARGHVARLLAAGRKRPERPRG